MNSQNTLRRTAAMILSAAALSFASTSASALCNIGTPTPASTVTPEAGGQYAYGYTVTGLTGSCVNFHGADNYVVDAFEVPYFTDAGITDILAPAGWTSQIVATDAFGLGHGAETLVWTADAGNGIQPGDGFNTIAQTLAGFGYTAAYASAYAPGGLQVHAFDTLSIVDPALPASPSALQAGLPLASFPSTSPVPEPSVLLTMLAGLAGIAFVRRRA